MESFLRDNLCQSEKIDAAKKLLKIQQKAISNLEDVLESAAFQKAVDLIINCAGRVVVSGMGKSGLIGQ